MNKKSIVLRINEIMNNIPKKTKELNPNEIKKEFTQIWVKLYSLIDDIESGE